MTITDVVKIVVNILIFSGFGAIVIVAVAAIMVEFCKVFRSGPREEETPQPHPCEECVRWFECNGVDEDCPWREKSDG